MKMEVDSLTDDQIKKRVKALEMENGSYKTETNRLRKEISIINFNKFRIKRAKIER